MARSNAKVIMTPLEAADKPRMLRKLQGSIYFEKNLTAFAAGLTKRPSTTVGLPVEFVEKHGDKFQKSVVLRTESCTVPWPVNLSVSFGSPCSARVRFEGGWKAFAVSHGLLEGDTLIFELTAMSDFKVHIFRGIGGIHTSPSRKRRRSAVCDFDRSPKTAKKPDDACKSESLSGSEDGSADAWTKAWTKSWTNGWRIGKMQSEDSAFDPGSLDHLPSFTKTMTATNVRPDSRAHLEIPGSFWRMHGHRIRSAVRLQGIQEQSPVSRPMSCYTSSGQDIRHLLIAGWRAFATENDLQRGQQLVFTLAADSFFVVRDRVAP